MSVWHRPDSIAEMNQRKTLEQVAAENEELKQKNEDLEAQVTDLQLALCDVFELVETQAAAE